MNANYPGFEGMPKVHGPSSSLGRLNAEKGTCKCGALHGPEDPHRISQEEMALMIDSWPPAIREAFSERWQEQLEAEMRSASASGSRIGNGLSSHTLEALLPEIVSNVTPEQLNAIASEMSLQEDLQQYEMTAGLTEPRPPQLPRKFLKIKRPGKQQKQGAAAIPSYNKAAPTESRSALPPIFTPEPPRGQKRSANSLFSDVPRPAEEQFLDSPNDTVSSSLSFDGEDLGEQLPHIVDLLAQHVYAESAEDLDLPANPAEELLRSEADHLDLFLGNSPGGLNSNALHIAAATGRADLVQQQLFAGVDPSAWIPTNSLTDTRAFIEYRKSSLQASSSMPTRLSNASAQLGLSSPSLSLEPSKSLPSGLGHAQPQIYPLNFDYCTAMHLAAYYGHWPVVKVLIESGTCDLGQLFSNRNAQGATALHMAAHKNCVDVVRGMLEVKQCEVNAVDNEGRTALHHAAAQGFVAVAQALWSAKCNIEAPDNHGWTALHHAADMGHVDVVADLIIGGANVQRVDNRGYTPAHLAAAAGHVDVVEKLLGAGYEVDTLASVPLMGGVYSTGNTCLHLAAQNGHLEMVECLLDRGANPRLIDYRGCDALQCSVEGGHEDVFKLLLEHGCDPLACDHLGATLLHYAANGGNLDIIKQLLRLGCNKDAVTQYGRTVLHYAAFSCRADALAMLVDLGCDVHHADHEGNTPWHSAAQSMSPELLQKLIDYGCSVNAINNLQCTALHYASRTGCLPVVDLLLDKGSDISAVCVEGKTALHCATQMGHVEVVKRLFNHGAEKLVNIEDRAKWTPLHFAAERGSLTLVNLFIQAGADVNAQTQQGWAPLHLSTKDNRLQVADALLAAGADSSLQDSQGRTALHFAARIGDVTMFQTIFKHPTCDPDLVDGRGFQLIHYAVEGGNRDIVKFLIDQDFGLPELTQDGRAFTPLHLASRAGHADLVSLLLNVGYSADRADKNGRTPLHCAAEGGHIGWLEANQANMMAPPGHMRPRTDHRHITRELLGQGVDPTALDDAMCTALHYACSSGDLEIVKELISLGCSPLEADHIGWTPVMWAAAGGHAPVIQELMRLGADIQVMDNQSRWPLHWAAEKGHVEAVDLLVKHLSDAHADLHLQDTVGYSAVNLAANQGHVEIVGRILDASREFADKRYTALHLAVQKDLEQLVQQLLLLPTTVVDARDADGQTALHLAAQGGKVKIAELLIGAKANIAATSTEGSTPLHKAAACGSMDVANMLLSTSGPNAAHLADVKSGSGVTAIQLAAGGGHTALVKLLINTGANVNACPLSNTTALYNAANGGYLDVVKMLIENHATVNCQTGSGATALHAAASSGHTDVVKFLLRKRASKDTKSQNGCTALHNATSNNHLPVVEILVAERADIDVINSQGNTALHIAASRGYDKIVLSLVNAGANVHAKNLKNLTAVGCAATGGHLEAVVELVRQGAAWRNLADVNVVKAIVRKTQTHKQSYLVGKLEIAERERARLKRKAAAVPEVKTEEELRQKEAAAESIAAELIKSEEADKLKDSGEKSKAKSKKNKKKNKAKKSSDAEDGDLDQPLLIAGTETETESSSVAKSPEGSIKADPAAAQNVKPDPLPDPPERRETPHSQKPGRAKGKKSKDVAAAKPTVQSSPKSRELEAASKAEHNDTGWTQVGPSGKIGHTPSMPASDSETSYAGQSGAWRNGEQADDKASGSKQPARNAQRPGTRQTSKNARQPAGSRTPESQKLTHHLPEPPHGGIHGLDGLAWSAQGPAQGNAKLLGRVDQGRAQRQGSRSVGTGFSTHTLNLAPPPPPPKQPATTAPPPPPHNPRTGSQQASARAELNSATASPSRSLPNGVSQRYAKYVASPSSQPSLSELEHGLGQHLMASPRADKLSLHSRRPPSLPHSPARPRPPALPASPSSSPQSSQPLTGQGERVTAHKRSHLTPQLGQSRLQSPLAAAAAQQPATSSREEPRQSFELPAGSPCRPAGGWNPLQSSSAVNSLIDWTHNVSSLQALDAGARGMGAKGQSANGLDSLSTSGAFSKPQSLTAALQDLNLQPASLDGVPAGGQKFGVVRSSGHSSMDNEVGSSAGGSLQHGFRVNPWGSQGAQLIDGSQGALPEPPKSSSRALCGLTKRPMHDPVVASDMVVYERSAIEEWMKHHDYSPVDPSKKFTDRELYPAFTMIALNGM